MTAFMLAAALVFAPADAQVAYKAAKSLVDECTPRDAGTPQAMRAAQHILDAVSSTGADARLDRFLAETPKGPRWFVNVESEYVSNRDAGWIVLVSHYDTKPGTGCPGANDGASTSGLLVSLSGVLFDQRPRGANVLMIWTDGEECMSEYGENDGLWGSRHAAEKLKESGRKVTGVVCLDMLGDKDLKVTIPRNTSPGFRRGVLKLAKAIGLGDKVASSEEMVKDDHVPFLSAGFKAIDLIDFEYGSAPGVNDYWHTTQDTMDKVSGDSLLVAGRLAVAIIDGLTE